MKQMTAALIGAGNRAVSAYGGYALKYQGKLAFTAVADPNDARRNQFGDQHNIPESCRFKNWDEFFAAGHKCDAVVVGTSDYLHFTPASKALEAGYHVMLEKPISPIMDECLALEEIANKHNRVLMLGYVLRYAPFFVSLKQVLDSGKIGPLRQIIHNESIGYWHFAHSFVRGVFRNTEISSPSILAKCSHDMDILSWLIGSKCLRLASFGSLSHFKVENAPENAAQRCTDGCPHERVCAYYAPNLYLGEKTSWPVSAISDDLSYEGRLKALKEGPFGKCVYRCDNNVADHQTITMEFENEVFVNFSMSAFTHNVSRTMRIMGEKGEILGHAERNNIQIHDYASGQIEEITPPVGNSSHGGGDHKLMDDFIKVVQEAGDKVSNDLVQSHVMAFAAEESRLSGRVVDLEQFIADHKKK